MIFKLEILSYFLLLLCGSKMKNPEIVKIQDDDFNLKNKKVNL